MNTELSNPEARDDTENSDGERERLKERVRERKREKETEQSCINTWRRQPPFPTCLLTYNIWVLYKCTVHKTDLSRSLWLGLWEQAQTSGVLQAGDGQPTSAR